MPSTPIQLQPTELQDQTNPTCHQKEEADGAVVEAVGEVVGEAVEAPQEEAGEPQYQDPEELHSHQP